MQKIRLPCLGAALFVYFDYHKFAKDYEFQGYEDGEGLSSGNGVYIDLDGEEPHLTCLHEIVHYVDWLFSEQFPEETIATSTEIRARLTEYLYAETIKIIEKKLAK